MAEPRLVVSIFDIFSPVRLSISINGEETVQTYPRGSALNFVFDARIRFLVPRQTLTATGVFLSLADPDGTTFLYKGKTTKETDYIFTYPLQSGTDAILGPYSGSVHVWRQANISYNTGVNYITEPFVAFILE